MGGLIFFTRKSTQKKFSVSKTEFQEVHKIVRIECRRKLVGRSILVILLGLPLGLAFHYAYAADHVLWVAFLLGLAYVYLLLVYLVQTLLSYLKI